MQVPASTLGPSATRLSLFVRDDLTTLDDCSDAAILHGLRRRFERGELFTRLGSDLVFLQPRLRATKTTDSWWGHSTVRRYINPAAHNASSHTHGVPSHTHGVATMAEPPPPHIFELANTAYTNLIEGRRDQLVVFRGRSGTGAHMLCRRIYQFLLEVADSPRSESKSKAMSVGDRMLVANKVLECFASAKTCADPNSERCVMMRKLYFEPHGRLNGVRFVPYFFERSRTTNVPRNERDFHSFYFLTRAATQRASDKRMYGLAGRPGAWSLYFSQSGCSTSESVSDVAGFRSVLEAMRKLGFPTKDCTQLFRLVSAVMSIGNIRFSADKPQTPKPAEGMFGGDPNAFAGPVLKVVTNNHLSAVADLLGVPKAALVKAFEQCALGDMHSAPATPDTAQAIAMANKRRDDLAKYVYNAVWTYVVTKLNQIMSPRFPKSALGTINILTGPGFETAPTNGFEQFCFNYFNEKVNSALARMLGARHAERLRAEGVTEAYTPPAYATSVLELCEHRKDGLLRLMYDGGVGGRVASDEDFVVAAANRHADTDVFSSSVRPGTASLDPRHHHHLKFTITHFEGEVTYDVSGFTASNRDRLAPHLRRLLATSSNPFVLSHLGGKGRGDGASRATHAAHMGTVLQQDMAKFSESQLHVVHCLGTAAPRATTPGYRGIASRGGTDHSQSPGKAARKALDPTTVLADIQRLRLPACVARFQHGLTRHRPHSAFLHRR